MSAEFQTPAWVHDAIFYQIFPDRFARSDSLVKPTHLEAWDSPPTAFGYKGGDLLGITEKLDYLQELGITAIYLNPIFQSASNHRYHTHDYFKVDPLLGGEAAFKKMLKAAHRRKMRVILDGVFNHASRGFLQFNDILENGPHSPYLDWFDIRGFPLNAYQGDPNYRCWWSLPALPEFNTDHPQVRDFIFSVAKYWLDAGIDGWRLDVPFCIEDDAFWQEFRQVVKTTNPEAYITGEIPMDATRWLHGDQFDGVMNYQLTNALWLYMGGKDGSTSLYGHWLTHTPGIQVDSVENFADWVEGLLVKYPLPAVQAQMNLLDSHDTARCLSIFNGRKDLLSLSVLFLMTYPGAPSVYYGDEIGLDGGNDPDCRKAFPWETDQWDLGLLGFYQRCIALRKAHPALRTGTLKRLWAKEDVYIYLRELDNDRVLVALNRSQNTHHVEIPTAGLLPEGLELKNEMAGGSFWVQQGHIHLDIAPITGMVLASV